MFLAYHLFAFLARHLPDAFLKPAVVFFAGLRYLTTPGFRKRLRSNYRVVRQKTGQEKPGLEKMVWRGYLNFGFYLAEFIGSPSLGRHNIREKITVRGEEHLRAAFARGKGVISLTAHLGNWEMAGLATSLLGYPVTAVALAQPDERINHFFMKRRRSKGVRVFLLGRSSARMLIGALRRNELVALLGDRAFAPPSVKAVFFGRETRLPSGPAELAVRTGATVLPGFMVRENGRLVLSFEPPFAPSTGISSTEAVGFLVRQYLDCLEKYIARYPDQWLVFDDLWKKGKTTAVSYPAIGARAGG